MGRCPFGDHRRACVEQAAALHAEISAEEEHRHRHTEQYAPYAAIEEKEEIVGAGAIDIARLPSVFIAYGLHDETEKNDGPEPVGSSETCGVEQWEGGEECASENHECGERELPFPSHGVDYEFTALPGVSAEQH